MNPLKQRPNCNAQKQSIWRHSSLDGCLILALSLALVSNLATKPCFGQAPLTYERVIDLLDLEVKEERILQLVQDSGTHFTLGAEQLKTLRAKGASEKLLTALSKRNGNLASQISTSASDVSDLVLILDCSGSMKDSTVDGQTKWKVAQKAALDLLAAIPDGKQLAFIVYGHRADLACRAVEVVRPLAPLSSNSRSALASIVNQLQPAGNTPIALALEMAAKELEFASGLSKVVMITDGIETCKGDPMAAAQKLAQSQKLLGGLQVIGFALRSEESAVMSQIAKEGNGRYFDAKDTTELIQSVQVVGSSITKTLTDVQAIRSDVKPSRDPNAPASIELGKYLSGRLAEGKGHYLTIDLPAGDYIALCEAKRGDNKDSNLQFAVLVDGSTLFSVNEIDRIERGAGKFHSNGGTHAITVQNRNSIIDYHFALYRADDKIPMPLFEVPNLSFEEVLVGQPTKVQLDPSKLATSDAYLQFQLEEGDYEVAFTFSSPNAKGNYGVILDSMNDLGAKVERIGSSYDSTKSQSIKYSLVVAEEHVGRLRIRDKYSEPIQGTFQIRSTRPLASTSTAPRTSIPKTSAVVEPTNESIPSSATKSDIKPSRDPNNPSAIPLGTIATGRLAESKGHFYSIEVPAGEYIAVCEATRGDGKDSNLQFALFLDGSPLSSVNEIDRQERSAAQFESKGGSHVLTVENRNDIIDYRFAIYRATDSLPLPTMQTATHSFQVVRPGQSVPVRLDPSRLETRDAFVKLELEEGDYEVSFQFSSPNAKGLFGAVLDTIDSKGVKVERIGYSYDSAKSQSVKFKFVVADQHTQYLRIRDKFDEPIVGNFTVTKVR